MGHKTVIRYLYLALMIRPILCSVHISSSRRSDLGLHNNTSTQGQLTYNIAKKDDSNRNVLPDNPNRIQHQVHIQDQRDKGFTKSSSASVAKAKFLSLFTVIQFTNIMCTVGNVMGFCVTASECTYVYEGNRIGSCARGYGTCCY
ncbi:unnamed protein product, partial [Meganyctiphanes norvegica]